MPLHDVVPGIPPEYRFDYVEFTAAVTVTATTSAGTAVVTGNSVYYNGATLICIEFFSPCLDITSSTGTSHSIYIELFEDATDLGFIGRHRNETTVSKGASCLARRFRTPAAGFHTYKATAWKDASADAASVEAGAGGAGIELPGYLLITRA